MRTACPPSRPNFQGGECGGPFGLYPNRRMRADRLDGTSTEFSGIQYKPPLKASLAGRRGTFGPAGAGGGALSVKPPGSPTWLRGHCDVLCSPDRQCAQGAGYGAFRSPGVTLLPRATTCVRTASYMGRL